LTPVLSTDRTPAFVPEHRQIFAAALTENVLNQLGLEPSVIRAELLQLTAATLLESAWGHPWWQAIEPSSLRETPSWQSPHSGQWPVSAAAPEPEASTAVLALLAAVAWAPVQSSWRASVPWGRACSRGGCTP